MFIQLVFNSRPMYWDRRCSIEYLVSIKVLNHCITHTAWMINGRMSTQTYGGI